MLLGSNRVKGGLSELTQSQPEEEPYPGQVCLGATLFPTLNPIILGRMEVGNLRGYTS